MKEDLDYIKNHCKIDHLNYSRHLPIKKNQSLYESSYLSINNVKKGSPLTDQQTLPKITNQNNRNSSFHVTPLISRYREDHSIDKAESIIKNKQRPSFFLKQKNIEGIKSEYQEAISLRKSMEDKQNMIQRGKPRCSNLSIPKYNQLSKRSIYRDSFQPLDQDSFKFPSIHNGNKVNSKLSRFS